MLDDGDPSCGPTMSRFHARWFVPVALAVVSFGRSSPSLDPQALPTDREILVHAYGRCDASGKTFRRAATTAELEYSVDHPDTVSYSVVFVSRLRVDSEDVVLAVCHARIHSLQDHEFGYRDYFLFHRKKGRIVLVKSQPDTDFTMLGDRNRFELAGIGRGKMALVSEIACTGSQHHESNRTFYSISRDGIRKLFTIDLAYSNESEVLQEKAQADGSTSPDSGVCLARAFESSYAILPGDKDWWDVRVHRTNFGFTSGCKARLPESEEDYLFAYGDSGYLEVEAPLAE